MKTVHKLKIFFIFLLFSAFYFQTEKTFQFFFTIFFWSNFFLLKIALIIFFSYLAVIIPNIYIERKHRVNLRKFHGVSIKDLSQFIYLKKGFPVSKSISELNITTKTHAQISSELQRWGVLKKQLPNNKLVLAPDISKEYLIKLLHYGKSFEIHRNQ